MIAEHFRAVMAVAPEYSPSPSPPMASRDVALGRAQDELDAALRDLAPELAAPLRVKQGGRQANYGPVPWIRIYSADHSPSAQAGYYLVYLFAADGMSVYLSLQQGTSEFRANAIRPIRDAELLRLRAANGRQVVEDHAVAPVGPRVCIDVDLAAEAVQDIVGAESLLRMHNYENVSSWAWKYEHQDLTTDDLLLDDLKTALPLLLAAYRSPHLGDGARRLGSGQTGAARPTARASAVQGLESDPEVRRAIELYAESLAESDLKARGWSVDPVGHLHLGYDLLGRRGSEELHVEVKGTRSHGEEIKLTGNEVRHLETGCPATHALFVASAVTVSSDGARTCSQGERSWHVPWELDRADLIVTEYRYRVPPAGPLPG